MSKYLKLPEETVYKYARDGRMPASKVGRYWRFDRDRLNDWVEGRSNQQVEAKPIVIVDDEPGIRSLFSTWCAGEGFPVQAFDNGSDAISYLATNEADLVLLDLMMPGLNGIATLKEVKKVRPDTDVIIVTSYFESHLMDQAMAFGPITVLKKPVEREIFIKTLHAHVRTSVH